MDAMAKPVRATYWDVLCAVLGDRRPILDFLRARTGFDVATFTNDCRSALRLSLERAVEPDEKVLVPGYTCRAVDRVVTDVAQPVYVDIDPETHNIDIAAAANVVQSDCSAILPVHSYGRACDMAAVEQFATNHALTIIEDAAQALGTTLISDAVATKSDYCAYSFRFSKEVTTGTGGLLLSHDELDETATDPRWRSPFAVALALSAQRGLATLPGFLYNELTERVIEPQAEAAAGMGDDATVRRLSTGESVLLTRQTQRLRTAVLERRENAAVYCQYLPTALGPTELNRDHAYYEYPIRVAAPVRDEFVASLRRQGVGCDRTYPYTNSPVGACPVADTVADQIVTLPVHDRLSRTDIKQIAAIVADTADRYDAISRRDAPE